MITFLLSLIPGPWLVVLQRLPWRLIGYALAAALAVWGVLAINNWRQDSNRLEATEKALATRTQQWQQCTDSQTAAALAYASAVHRAEFVAAADKITAERVERELQTNLAAADAGARDLARRLRDYQAGRCGGTVPAVAGATAKSAAPTEEPGDGEAVDAAIAAHLAACAADAVDLAGWNNWWAGVKEGRAEPVAKRP